MRNITFSKDGDGKYISEITITAPAVLHLERDKGGVFYYEKSHLSNGNYSPVNYSEMEYLESAKTIDLVLQDAIYPLYIKVTSTSKPTAAVIGNPSNVICTDETNAELMNVARAQGWVAEDATEMTEGEAFAVTSLPTGSSVWGNCTSLNELEYFNSVTKLYDTHFGNCKSLTSIVIPSSVTSIGTYVFYNCSALTSVKISEGVTNIGKNAFRELSALTSIVIPSSVTSIGEDAFYNCTGLTSVKISMRGGSIGDYAFYNCSALTSVKISEGVTNIGNVSFGNLSALTSIVIPSSVTSIGFLAFTNCAKLGWVYCNPTTPPSLGSSAFDSNATDRKIYVPSASVDTYKGATNWSKYADYIVAQS